MCFLRPAITALVRKLPTPPGELSWMIVMVLIYTNLSTTPLWIVVGFNVLMMAGIMSRMIPSTALVTAVPVLHDRGAFMSINSSLQQIAGGIAAAFAGMIVVQKTKFSPLEHYNTLGYVIVVITIISVFLIYRVSNMIKGRVSTPPLQKEGEAYNKDTELLTG